MLSFFHIINHSTGQTLEARQGLGSNTWQRLHDSSFFPDRHINSTWHRCLAQVCSPAGMQSLVCAAQRQRKLSQSPGQCPGSQMTPHQTATCSYLWLVLWGTDSCVCMHSFCQLDCAEAFIDTSALSLLLPSLATKAIAHSQADSQEEKLGISGAHTMFAKDCLIPIFLFMFVSSHLSFLSLCQARSLSFFPVLCYKTGSVCFPEYVLPRNTVYNCASYSYYYWSAAIQKLLGILCP